jgi:hypothetical protein
LSFKPNSVNNAIAFLNDYSAIDDRPAVS